MRFYDHKRLYFAEPGSAEGAASGEATPEADTGTKSEEPRDGTKADPKDGAKKADPRDEKKYSDNDVDKMKVKWKKDSDRKASEAAKLEKMNAEERMKYEYDQLKAELDCMKREHARAEMAKTVRAMLSESGVSVSDELSDMLVQDDAEATKRITDAFVKTFKAAVQQGVKDALSHKAPKAGGSGKKAVTRADWEKERDPVKRQHMLKDNPRLLD